jgi:hypothetical protein
MKVLAKIFWGMEGLGPFSLGLFGLGLFCLGLFGSTALSSQSTVIDGEASDGNHLILALGFQGF